MERAIVGAVEAARRVRRTDVHAALVGFCLAWAGRGEWLVHFPVGCMSRADPELVVFDGAAAVSYLVDAHGLVRGPVEPSVWRGAAGALRAIPIRLDPKRGAEGPRRAWMLSHGAPSGVPYSVPSGAKGPVPSTEARDYRFLDRVVWRPERRRWDRAFRIQLPFPARTLASTEQGVWVGASRRFELAHFTRTGECNVMTTALDADGIDALRAASAQAGGGVWAAAGGALLRVHADGRRLPGQGGFAHAVDLAPVTARAGL